MADEMYDEEEYDDDTYPRFTKEQQELLQKMVDILNERYAGKYNRLYQPGKKRFELEFQEELEEYPCLLHDFGMEESEPFEVIEDALDFILRQSYWFGKEE